MERLGSYSTYNILPIQKTKNKKYDNRNDIYSTPLRHWRLSPLIQINKHPTGHKRRNSLFAYIFIYHSNNNSGIHNS